MFTGIITEIGKVKSLRSNCLTIIAPQTAVAAELGDSIAVNGVCLTVTDKTKDSFSVDLLQETLTRTNLKNSKSRDTVNLELALRLNDRISGHIVTGHIDEVGRISAITKRKNDRIIEIHVSSKTIKAVAVKGSIAVDGISLTVVKVSGNRFQVHLVPFTMNQTTLGQKRTGHLLNIEIDILARYAERLLRAG